MDHWEETVSQPPKSSVGSFLKELMNHPHSRPLAMYRRAAGGSLVIRVEQREVHRLSPSFSCPTGYSGAIHKRWIGQPGSQLRMLFQKCLHSFLAKRLNKLRRDFFEVRFTGSRLKNGIILGFSHSQKVIGWTQPLFRKFDKQMGKFTGAEHDKIAAFFGNSNELHQLVCVVFMAGLVHDKREETRAAQGFVFPCAAGCLAACTCPYENLTGPA